MKENCVAMISCDTTSILINGGNLSNRLDNTNSTIQPVSINNGDYTVTDRFDSILDVGHHFDNCPTPRIRTRMVAPQYETHNIPRVKLLSDLEMQGKIRRPAPMGSTSTNI